MKRTRLLLADDQALFREALRTLLSLQPDFEIVGEAANGAEAIRAAAQLNPDVVLMDLRMPVLGGVEATKRLRSEVPSARVIVLTTFEEDEEVRAALQVGACGYLLKASPAERLCEAIRVAMRGEAFLEPSVTAKLVAAYATLSQQQPRPVVSAARLLDALSTREREVLQCLAEGLSNKEIASRLSIAEGTVKNHMSQVLSKLGALDRTQAALRARELGLL